MDQLYIFSVSSSDEWYWTDHLPVTYTNLGVYGAAGHKCVQVDVATGQWQSTICSDIVGLVCKAPLRKYRIFHD